MSAAAVSDQSTLVQVATVSTRFAEAVVWALHQTLERGLKIDLQGPHSGLSPNMSSTLLLQRAPAVTIMHIDLHSLAFSGLRKFVAASSLREALVDGSLYGQQTVQDSIVCANAGLQYL